MHSIFAMIGIFCMVRLGQSQPSQTCIYTCLNRFTSMADKLMGSSGGSGQGGMNWQNLLHMSNNGQRTKTEQEMKKNFDDMCNGYRTMKRCIAQCRDPLLRDSVVSGFASIQYVCEDKYKEFITHLPCLAANERRVVERCSKETNQTAAAIAALEKTVFRNDVAKMTTTLAALCRNTSQIVDCLTPATQEMCGKRPANILKRLVTLGFRSIEQMYKRMKIQDKLPRECSKLAQTPIDDKDDDHIKYDEPAPLPRPRGHGTTRQPTHTKQRTSPTRNEENSEQIFQSNIHDDAHGQTGGANSINHGFLNFMFVIFVYLLTQ